MAEDKKSPSTTASVSGDECGATSVGEGSEGSTDSGSRNIPSKAPVSWW